MRSLRILLAGVLLCLVAPAPAEAAVRRIDYRQWTTTAQLERGVARGVSVAGGHLSLGTPVGTRRLGATTYEWGDWTSPWVAPGFDATELVPSWAAATPGNTFVRVQLRGVTPAGAATGWDTLARWADGDRWVRRTSLGSQPDGGASVAYDTWLVPAGVRRWQLRVTLFRRAGRDVTPSVDTLGAMASRLPAVSSVPVSRPTGLAAGVVLPVPRYSQMTHRGEYPAYDGGGEAWCSPTSTTMVLAYYDRLPRPSSYAWVDDAYDDPEVDHAARKTFDAHLDGTGNWPFNTAYAASLTGHAFVTRMRSLRDAERFIAAGIPVVASIAFGRGELTGAPISASNGHLLVIVGFTNAGDVVVNDPAASRRAGVRRTYRRAQFETAWLKRYRSGGSLKGSGGVAYVVRDAAHPLPARSGVTNW